jgi:transcription initiation factor TFIIE subunit beta
MSTLAKDAAAFKSDLARQDYASWHSNPAPPQPAGDIPVEESGEKKKKKKAKHNVVYSQPADTGTGSNVNTQLVYAVAHLKSTPNPMRLEDIAIVTNTPLTTDLSLLEKFKHHDRVAYDPKTDLYSYKHDYNVRSKPALLTEIQRHTRKGRGLAVRALKDSWKEAPQAIEELEKEGEVFVTRTAKDGQLRMVFYNEVKGDDQGPIEVEKEFVDLWHSLKVPNETDLLKDLASEGLQATAAEATIPKTAMAKKKGKKTVHRQRHAKITNTHLVGIDLSKDYIPAK